MRILHKLLLGFLGAAALVGLLAYVGIEATARFDAQLQTVVEENVPAIQSLERMRAATLTIVAATREYHLGSSSDVPGIEQEQERRETRLAYGWAEYDDALAISSDRLSGDTAGGINPEALFRDRGAAFRALGVELVDLIKSGAPSGEIERARGEFDASAREFFVLHDVIMANENSRLEEKSAVAAADHASTRRVLALVGAASVAAAIGMGVLLSLSISRPIERLRAGTLEVARGKFGARVELRAKDDLRDLADAFNEMSAGLKRSNDEIVSSKMFLDDILHSMSTPLFVVDQAGNVQMANDAARTATSLDAHAIVGRPLSGFVWNEEGDEDLLARVIKEGTLVQLERRLRVGDAGAVPVSVSAKLLRGPANGVQGMVVLVEDITAMKAKTERRIADIERLREIERLQELDSFRSNFLNNAAHELGTPLTPLKVQLHILRTRDNSGLTPTQRSSLDMIDRNIQRLAGLVKDILDAAKLQVNRLGIKPQRIDLNRVVLEAVESFEAPAQLGGIEIEASLSPDMVVDADPARITQVLFNLLTNAIKFTPRGGRIVVRTQRRDGGLRVTVTDTGPGLRPDQIQRLFQPFSQVHDTMQTTAGGSGLGLHISRGILALHGGRVWCESDGPGSGSQFTFELPDHDRIEEGLVETRQALASAATDDG